MRDRTRMRARRAWLTWLAGLALVVTTAARGPLPASAHPLGNFSISHYAGIRIEREGIRLRYVVDMAEIPTFQEIQETGIIPDASHPSLAPYLARRTQALAGGLRLELNGRRLPLRHESSEILFPPGAAGLPTLKLGIVFRVPFDDVVGGPGASDLRYEDVNFPHRAGWKEVVATAGAGVVLVRSSVPERDRSRELSDYPADLLDTLPQDLAARIVFTRAAPPATVARGAPRIAPASRGSRPVMERPSSAARAAVTAEAARSPGSAPVAEDRGDSAAEPARLEANRQGTPRNAFTELVAAPELGPGIVLLAMAVAASLGAFHALEPGHGKTVVAAYLVGARGTAWHAVALGLIVTASHTAGVYALGAVTLYASRYVVPERLYPWLGVVSGLTIAVLGCGLILRRWAGPARPHRHGHVVHDHGDGDAHGHDHPHGHHHGHAHGHRHGADGPLSPGGLVALGITGGMMPCPAALVVLLSAVALRREGFGLLLIVAFSAGLAAVLIGIGLLMVSARRVMSRFRGDGPLVTRWLPLTSAAVITLSGMGITAQALASAGVLQLRL